MIRKLIPVLSVLLLTISVGACSSPEEKAADYIASGDQLFEEGDFSKAQLEYRNALQINQNLPDAWYGIARIHERKQEWRKAYGTLNRIREISPNHVDGRLMLAQILLASNQIDQALSDATEVLELAPNDARAHALMAAVQFRLENYDDAMSEVDKALAIEPANNEAVLVRARVLIAEEKHDEALAILDEAIGSNAENVSMYLMKIQAHQELDDIAAIEGVYLQLIEVFPENLAFKHALARLYLQQEKVDAAEKTLEQIVASNPDDIDEKLRLVKFKMQFRSPDQAINLLQSYIDDNPEEYRYQFQLGELYENQQQTDSALSLYQDIVNREELSPNGIQARNKIALIELRAGNREKAEKLVDEVLAHDANNEDALLLRAGFQISKGDYDEALVSARTVLRDNPESLKALGLLGQAYNRMGSNELAVESYTKAFNLNPGTPVIANQLARNLIRQRKFDQADEILQESIRRGNRSIDAVKLLVQVKLARGEWDQAERLAQELSKVKGQEAVSEQVLGVVYQGREQQDESIAAFKRAHELAPEAVQPLVALVRTYVQSGDREKARQLLNSTIETNPENIMAYRLLAQISLMENKIPEAIAHIDKTIEINPNIDFGYRSLAAVYRRAGEIDKAEASLERGLDAIPENPNLLMTLASIYEVRGQFAKAIDIYESILEKNPDALVAKNNLASLLTDYRDDQASHDRARTMAAEFKDSPIPQFRDTYAWAAVKSGLNLEEATIILEGIVEENDSVGVYKYHLGEAYRKKGDTENALAMLKQAAEQLPPGSDLADKANEALEGLN